MVWPLFIWFRSKLLTIINRWKFI